MHPRDSQSNGGFMEPTIYKPSIYKGAGIYKIGAEGGGGISNQIPQEFVYKNILGKNYKCVEIESGIFWPIESLEYIDENIELITSSLDYNYSIPQAMGKNYSASGVLYYNKPARNVINSAISIQTTLKPISKIYFDKLMKYVLDKIKEWKGENVYLENNDITTMVKFSEFGNYESWLALIDIGINISGSYLNSGAFELYPYGYTKPVYFGVTSSPTEYGQMINLQYGKELNFFSGNMGTGNSYQMRFFIDEN